MQDDVYEPLNSLASTGMVERTAISQSKVLSSVHVRVGAEYAEGRWIIGSGGPGEHDGIVLVPRRMSDTCSISAYNIKDGIQAIRDSMRIWP